MRESIGMQCFGRAALGQHTTFITVLRGALRAARDLVVVRKNPKVVGVLVPAQVNEVSRLVPYRPAVDGPVVTRRRARHPTDRIGRGGVGKCQQFSPRSTGIPNQVLAVVACILSG